MKIPVPVKRVVDYNVKVRVKADGRRIDTANVTMSIKPVDEIAVEEAVRIKEAGFASEVIAVFCGGNACQETLRAALAIGADRANLVDTGDMRDSPCLRRREHLGADAVAGDRLGGDLRFLDFFPCFRARRTLGPRPCRVRWWRR